MLFIVEMNTKNFLWLLFLGMVWEGKANSWWSVCDPDFEVPQFHKGAVYNWSSMAEYYRWLLETSFLEPNCSWVWILSLNSQVTTSKLLNFSVPQFPYLTRIIIISTSESCCKDSMSTSLF